MIEEAIVALCALPNELKSIRVYPNVAPQDATAPFIVYERVSTYRPHSLSARSSGVAAPRFTFRCWSDKVIGARDLVEALRVAIDGQSGTWGGCEIQGVFAEDDRDTYDSDRRLFGREFDAIIWHTESVPAAS